MYIHLNMRKINYFSVLLIGLMSLCNSQLSGQPRDTVIEHYMLKLSTMDSSAFYGEKLFEYTKNKPAFLASHLYSCTVLFDRSIEKFDSPRNKFLIQKIYEIITSDQDIDLSEKMDGFRILGDYYFESYDVDQAMKFYNRALEIADTPCADIKESYLCILYINLANIYIDLNEFNKARLLIEKTIELDLNFEFIDDDNLGIDYSFLARTYRPDDPEKSLLYFLKAKSHFNAIAARGDDYWNPESVIDLYLLLADNYLALDNPEQGLLEIDTALMIADPKIKEVSLHYINAIKTKANIFQQTGAYQKALNEYRTVNLFLEKNGANPIYRPDILIKMARCYLGMNQPAKAEQQLEAAFTLIDQSGAPHQSRLDKTAFPHDLFHLYYEQAKVLTATYKSTQEVDLLYQAQKAYREALTIFEILKNRVSERNSRQVLMKNNAVFFESAIDLNFQIWEQTADSAALYTILFLSEKSKNNSLYESLNKSNSSITSTLPDSVGQQIKALDLLIAQTEKKLFQAQLSNDPLLISAARDQLIRQRESHKVLMQNIEEKYPYFYQLKYHTTVPDLKTLQEALHSEEGILSYYVGVDYLYTILIDKWDFTVERIPMDFSLSDKLATFNHSIITSRGTSAAAKEALSDYQQTGFFLYQKLIAPFIRKLPARITIIPDNLLENLSFDALLTALPNSDDAYQDYPFLLNKYTISYQYAADAFTRPSGEKEFQHHFLAFAPTFSKDKEFSILKLRDFGELYHNTKEVDNIKNILEYGSVLKGKQATEDNFMKLAPDYQIIHLATHGKVNTEHPNYSYLAFQEIEDSLENELLYIKDIYGLQLQAELVVLSACETANGKLAQGDGIVNLARGFTYSGARAVVPTLWKISDAATADLMGNFYQELKNGEPKNMAMAKAKHHFLENTAPQFAHPFFWAAFVMIGDPSPILLPQTAPIISYTNALWSGTGILLLLLLAGTIKFAWKRWR